MSTPALSSYRMTFPMKAILFIFLAAGAVCLHLTFAENTTKGWYAYLQGTVMFLGFGLCGLFFTAIQHLTRARWSVAVRRVMESMAMSLPIAALLGVGVYFGIHHIYEWSHHDKVVGDHLLEWKAPFLNESFFSIRLVAYFVIWIVAMIFLVRNSFKQDKSGDEKFTLRNQKGAALVLIFFALSVSMASFDLIMSLEPHWFSTMFGVHYFASFFQAGLAIMILFTWALYKRGVLKDFINIEHFYELGKFLYGFSIFWGYIAFSEYLLIWYANLPEETFFYIERWVNGWVWLGLTFLILRLFVPMLAILPFGNKRNFKFLIPVCIIILVGHFVEMFWLVQPAMRLQLGVDGIPAVLGWKDVGIGLGFMSLFVLTVTFVMERIKMVPVGDPYLEASVHHHG